MAKPVTVKGGTLLPSVKAVSVLESSIILAKIIFSECPSKAQESTLRSMFAVHKKQSSAFMLAMEVDGRTIRFRPLGNKTPPTETALRDMLDAMGIGEVNFSPPPPSKTKNKVSLQQSRNTKPIRTPVAG